MVDLGSGAGFGINSIRCYDKSIRLAGYENEPSLIKIARRMGTDVQELDILNLSQSDISGFRVVYFYEPIYKYGLCEMFIENLVPNMSKGQYLIQKPIGNSTVFLKKSPHMKLISESLAHLTFERI